MAIRALRAVDLGGQPVFFWSSTLSAFSYPVAAWLARRIGLVNTMVFTHIPSSLFLILAAFSSNIYLALGLLLARSALSQMDVPTRTSYVMAVVTPAERAAAASVTAVPRSLASAISPTFAGMLLVSALPGMPLVACGGSRSPTTSHCCFRSDTSSHLKKRWHRHRRSKALRCPGRSTMKWITREHVKVDRVACPWLIRKFVDKDAEFIFVPAERVMDEASGSAPRPST